MVFAKLFVPKTCYLSITPTTKSGYEFFFKFELLPYYLILLFGEFFTDLMKCPQSDQLSVIALLEDDLTNGQQNL